MMKDNAIIESFIEVLKDSEYPLAAETIADLYQLDKTLSNLQNQPIKLGAEAIIAWCKEHPEVRDVVRYNYNNNREIQTAGSGESASTETTLVNHYPRIKEAIKNCQNPPNPPADSTTNNSNNNP
ncbi:hypothetical protein [Cylindrospermum sp. FACHB-282]|uniref:hypothetical protein n=1 Tax=Cylindrospermum sp. FACHB-282 TaxID=2692794 RepID=UPI0016897FEF|nr:hypothetical protein [Cylindrospermum sp. FACHB-282]MBD2384180.1 hypothetical protein [Cylindrospermum sp. FACHB-282]